MLAGHVTAGIRLHWCETTLPTKLAFELIVITGSAYTMGVCVCLSVGDAGLYCGYPVGFWCELPQRTCHTRKLGLS